jgi:hypothetical protein
METILQRVKKSIESAIQEEFESFVSEMEVYKNGTRKIKPKTYFGRMDLSIPRTRYCLHYLSNKREHIKHINPA